MSSHANNLSVRIATLNINNITSKTKLDLLQNTIRLLDIDVICLQEIKNKDFELNGFDTYTNVDYRERGTAIGIKKGIKHSNVEKSLDGRLITAMINDKVKLVNLYAPSGTQNKQQRDNFYKYTLAYYLRHSSEYLIIAGDFNCVTNPNDATGSSNVSSCLKQTIQHLNVDDTWTILNNHIDYTYITSNTASRIDRIYISKNLKQNLRTTNVHSVAVSDHRAYVIRIAIPHEVSNNINRTQKLWSLRKHLFTAENLDQFRIHWTKWTRQKKNYRSWLNWWLDYAKPNIKRFFKWKNNEYYKTFNHKHNVLLAQLNQSYNFLLQNPQELANINRIKAEILTLQRSFTGNYIKTSSSYISGENISTFHLNERAKRRTEITKLKTENDGNIESQQEILRYLEDHFKKLFTAETLSNDPYFSSPITIPRGCAVNNNCTNEISTDEIYLALKSSNNNRSPGFDGIPKEFYEYTFDIIHKELNLIMNDILRIPIIPNKLTEGIIVLIKKHNQDDSNIDSFRPISLLNTDFKLFNRIIKYRMTEILKIHKIIPTCQKCCNDGKNIFQALLSVKDRIIELQKKHKAGKLISFDLSKAFD